MQGDEDGHSRRRKICPEVDAVQVNEIDPVPSERMVDRVPVVRMDPLLGSRIDEPIRCRYRDQPAGRLRAFAGDDERLVPGFDQCAIEGTENLLRTAHRIRAHGSRRESNTEDPQHGPSPRVSRASPAIENQWSERMPQLNMS